MEESSATASWRSTGAMLSSGVESDDLVNERRKKIAELSEGELLQWVTSIHEHNHFLTHTGSAFGLLVSHAHLLRHAFLMKVVRREIGPGMEAVLDLYDRTIFSLTGYAEEWTQERAAEALNAYYLIFEQPGPRFVPTRPNAPACPDYRFAYANLLEGAALVAERRFALRYAPQIDAATIFRYHARDHALYFHLLQSLMQVLNLLGPSELAIKIALSGPVPVFGSSAGETLDWESFHPGYRLMHMVGATQPLTQNQFAEIAKAVQSGGPAGMDQETVGSLVFVLKSYQGLFDRAPYDRGRFFVRGDGIGVEKLKSLMTPKALNFVDNLQFEPMDLILQHGFDALNEAQSRAQTSPILAHMSFVMAQEGSEPDVERLIHSREQHSALFSLFDGELRSAYLPAKTKEVGLALVVAMRSELLHELSIGRSPTDSENVVIQRYAGASGAADNVVVTAVKAARKSLVGGS